MPQRHRPRLKQYAITCSSCGASDVKLYPSRESVRRKLSPYRFCSSTCQRDHWEARRKAEWSGAPYPCAQCGTAITPQQAAGRRRSYCNDTCKQKAARERRRRNPAGAVMAARQQFKEAWHQAVRAALTLSEFIDFVKPVESAYNEAVPRYQAAASDEERAASTQPIRDAIVQLAGPQAHDEPDRTRAGYGRWQDWWEWRQTSLAMRWSIHGQRLDEARTSTEELRKAERVAARRAETARLRRAGPDTTTAPGE